MEWIYYDSFESIGAHHLYEILKLRQLVFIIEQNCIYEDIDDYDQTAAHLLLLKNGELAGYSRLLPPGKKYNEASVGRIVVSPDFRKLGYGKDVVTKSIEILKNQGHKNIRIEAQAYLKTFYSDLGFTEDSEIYPVDGIPHLQMILNLT
jgi:ElaA protein